MFNAYEFGVTSNKYYSLVFYFVDLVLVWIALISVASVFSQFFFFFFSFQPQWLTRSSVNSAVVHCLRTHKLHFLSTFSLKIGPTVLFTHLKIILLQYFQFSVFSFQFSVSAK